MKELLFATVMMFTTSAFAADIDYSKPELYLKSSSQATISKTDEAVIRAELDLSPEDKDYTKFAAIHLWLRENFENDFPEDETSIGADSISNMMKTRILHGCHDWGIFFSAVLRLLGYPAVMVDTASIKWAREYTGNDIYSGHIFVETFVKGRWIIIDPVSGKMALDYNPENPVIPLTIGDEPHGFYVLYKGISPLSYWEGKPERLHQSLKTFAAKVKDLKISYPDYEIVQMVGKEAPIMYYNDKLLSSPCTASPCRGRNLNGVVIQTAGKDIHMELKNGQYLARIYPGGLIFNAPTESTEVFKTLSELRAYIKSMGKNQ